MSRAARVLPDLSEVQADLDGSPFINTLGMKLVRLTEREAEFEVTAGPQTIGNQHMGTVHGGVVAAWLDTAADYALIGTIGQPVPTIDFTLNYLRAVRTTGALRVIGRVVRPGRQVSVAEAELVDETGKVLALGRGTYQSSLAEGNAS